MKERIKECSWIALRVAYATSFLPALAAGPWSFNSAQYPLNKPPCNVQKMQGVGVQGIHAYGTCPAIQV